MRGCSCRGTAGFVHVSCLAEQAKIWMDEAEENDLDGKALDERWNRWHTCGLCKQQYHGVVWCALGWACWKTYVGRPETDELQGIAMAQLGNGLYAAGHSDEALSVEEANLSMRRRLGGSEDDVLIAQGCLAVSYANLGRDEEALSMTREVYSGRLKLDGEEDRMTIAAASNYAAPLCLLQRFEEAKALLRRTIPTARRVLGENDNITLRMRHLYAAALHQDPGATLDDLRVAVTTFEDVGRIARRVLGGAHPFVLTIEQALRRSREVLSAREVSIVCEAVEAMTPGDA